MDFESVLAGSVIGAFVGFYFMGALIFYILTVITDWKILVKAYEPG